METVVLITSVIMPEHGVRMENGSIRSVFVASERLIQTVATLHSIQLQLPNARIVLCDGSKPNYGEWFGDVFPELTYIHVESFDSDIALKIRSCGNKSLGECHLLIACDHICKDLIHEADHVIKVSGRYMVEGLNEEHVNALAQNCYYFPKQQDSDIRPWIDPDGVDWSLARHAHTPPTSPRIVLPTVIYGWGKMQTADHFERIKRIMIDLHNPAYKYYDIENLLARELAITPIVHTDWRYMGWNGPTGDFIRR